MLAKLTRPDAAGAVIRDRLFTQLDLARASPIIWISSPAGAGKTTLISSYIESCGVSELWYQVDDGDADMPTFFHYLGQAVKSATRTRKKMPVLTPEFQHGVPEFTRNYFRELFGRLNAPAVLVLDNFQDAGQESDLHQLLPDALQEVPEGINVIIISRSDPSASYARLRGNQSLNLITWSDLQFTVDEELAISKKRYPHLRVTKKQLQNLNTHIQGWVTGLILLLEQGVSLSEIEFGAEDLSQEYLFDYFSSEIFQNADRELQEFLLKTSLLPKMNASICKVLTGNSKAKKILSTLTSKQYFTVRHGLLNPSYQYHPLFRKFLQHRAQSSFNKDEYKKIQNVAGMLLAEAGDLSNAVSLLAKGESWGALEELLLKQAEKQIEQGRNKKVIQWIELLPNEIVDNQPWLVYWLAKGNFQYDCNVARSYFEKSYELFSEEKNVKGLYLSWCGVADSFIYEYNSFEGADHWIDELDQLQKTYSKPLSFEIRGHLAFSVTGLLIWANPAHVDLPMWIEKIEAMYKFIPSRSIKILCATQLSLYYSITGQISKTNHVTKKLESVNLLNEDASFLTALTCVSLIANDWLTAEFKLDGEYIDYHHNKMKAAGIMAFSGMLIAQGMYHAVHLRDLPRLEKLLVMYKNDISDDNILDQGHYHYHLCNLEILRNQFDNALRYNNLAIELIDKACSPFPQWVSYTTQAYLYVEKGQFDLAKQTLDSVQHTVKGMNLLFGFYITEMIYGYLSFQQNDKQKAISQLRSCFKLGCDKGLKSGGVWPPKMISTMCALALENNIEPEYTKSIIRLYNYTPQDSLYETEHWPYPIKIYTLNRFGIIKDDKTIHPSSKVQQFLKALIALGGRDVHEETLSNALWPDAEGDTAHQSFATTLHRVRKLIGNQAIQLHQHHLSLDPQFCWIDIWSLKRTLNEIDKEIMATKKALPELTEQAIKLYQGPFLGSDENESWMLSPREQLSNQFLRMLTRVADSFCQINECAHALDCYQKGLEIDDLSENFYQGLMHCHDCTGNKAAGLAVYQRCCEKLETTFGIKPSSETQRLYQALKEG